MQVINSDVDNIRYRSVWTKKCLNVRFLSMLSFLNNGLSSLKESNSNLCLLYTSTKIFRKNPAFSDTIPRELG